jgi:polysaccharide deacetylase 2 family uncharacterized protein YibQ
MPRSKRKPPSLPRTLVVLVLAAVLLFVGGEAWVLLRSGKGVVTLARWRLLDPRHAASLFAREIRAGIDAAGIPPDSVAEGAAPEGPAAARWHVGLRPGASLLQVNYAVSRRIEALGGVVLDGREAAVRDGATRLTLVLGFPGRPLHELVVVRAAPSDDPGARPAPRLALVLFGLGDDAEAAQHFLDLAVPFAVAIVPGSRESGTMFRAVHEKGREVVLHIPLEPINYPRLNPGPGTLLVTMKPDRITGTVRRWLDRAKPVVGAANHMGSLATQDMTLMRAVYRELARRRLPFIHVQPVAGAVCRSLAAEMGVVYDEPDAVIDAEARTDDARALDRRWSQVLRQARRRGHMAVWVRATPLTHRWLPRVTTPRRLRDVDLAPLSGVIRRPARL